MVINKYQHKNGKIMMINFETDKDVAEMEMKPDKWKTPRKFVVYRVPMLQLVMRSVVTAKITLRKPNMNN